MRPFNLEEYLKNPERKIITRDGHSVRIVCTDVRDDIYPIIAIVRHKDGFEDAYKYTKQGAFFNEGPYGLDLFFTPEEYKGWINVYSGSYFSTSARIFSSEEEAKEEGKKWKDYVTTIKIEWET